MISKEEDMTSVMERINRKRWRRNTMWSLEQRYTAQRERVARQLAASERMRAGAVAQAAALQQENAELRRLLGFHPKRATWDVAS